MALESGSFISDLIVTNPTPQDKRRFGDDHLRLLKTTIKNTLPNVNGAVNASDEELNFLVGVTSLVQTQLDTKLEASDVGAVGGDGIDVTGPLSAISVAVDATVVRTTGAQTIAGVKTFSSRPIFSGAGGFLSHDNAANSSGRIVVTNVEPTDTVGLNPGDIVLVY